MVRGKNWRGGYKRLPSSARSLQYLLLFSYLCVRKITFIWGIPQKFVFVFYIKKISFICGITQIFVVVFLFLKEITFIRRPTQIFDFLLWKNHLHLWYHSNICCCILNLKKSPSSEGLHKYLLFDSYFRKITFVCGINQIFVVVFLFQRNHPHQRAHSNTFVLFFFF